MSHHLEQQFSEIEKGALVLEKSAGALEAAAKALLKAARDGDASAVERASDRLSVAVAAAVAESEKVAAGLQFRGERLESYLAGDYRSELLEVARQNGVALREALGLLSAY